MRLTKQMKQNLLADFEAKAFKKELAEWSKETLKLAMEAYDLHIPKEVQKAAKKLPPELLRWTSSLCLTLRDAAVGGKQSDVKLGIPKTLGGHHSWVLLPDSVVLEGSSFTIVSSELYLRGEKQMKQLESLEKKYFEARNMFNSLLNQAKNTQQLEEAWPEGAQFLPGYKEVLKAEKPNALPMVILNKNLLATALTP